MSDQQTPGEGRPVSETPPSQEQRKPQAASEESGSSATGAAGARGGIGALWRGAIARARSVGKPRGGLIVLVLIALALVAVLFLFPWQSPQEAAKFRQDAANRLAALEETTTSLKTDVDETSRRLGALERAYAELAAEGAGATDMESLNNRVAGLITTVEDLSTRMDALESGAPAPSAAGNAQPQPTADIQNLRTQVTNLESKLDTLNTTLRSRIDVVEARIGADFTDRLSALEQAQSSGPTKADIEGIAARITLLESSEGAAAVRRATRALAVSTLSQAVRSDAPFTAEIALVSDLMADEPALSTLKVHADEGVPSTATLQREFAAASRAASAAGEETDGGSFLARAWHSITGLVTVRRKDGTTGNNPDAVLARMETALTRQDVIAAVSEAQALSGAPRQALEPWLDKAREHVEAEKALRTLQATVLRDLAQN